MGRFGLINKGAFMLFQDKMGSPSTDFRMNDRKGPRRQRLIFAALGMLCISLALLRLFGFAHSGVHLRLQRAGSAEVKAHGASVAVDRAGRPTVDSRQARTEFAWTDRFGDGTPDFMRLTDPADQAAFRQWFTQIADFQAVRPKSEVPPEITDCAGLLRYAYSEALKRHDDTWFSNTGLELTALPGEIRAWRYPDTPLGAGLFRVQAGSFTAQDASDGTFAQFADAKTLVALNAYLVSRDVRQAQSGDLLFYRQFGQSSPWHSMIVTRAGEQAEVVYDTGADHGKPGELRRVALAELLDHPQAEWRPVAANPNFMGVYRWNILRGSL
jgi:uncharacterized protein YfaT (DUF1175 family)